MHEKEICNKQLSFLSIKYFPDNIDHLLTTFGERFDVCLSDASIEYYVFDDKFNNTT